MKLEGYLKKVGSYWAVEFPPLGVHTQGRSKKDAYEMAKDAIETVADHTFTVDIEASGDLTFTVEASDQKKLISYILKRSRTLSGLTAKQVAMRMKEKSITGYLRYEQGKSTPSIEKFSEILTAIDPSKEPVLKIG